MTPEEKTIKNSYCQRCDYETLHTILHRERVDGDEDYHCIELYMISKCNGCEMVSFRKEFVDFENSYPDDNNNWEPEITITTYPQKRIQEKLENIYILPEKIRIVYSEAINAFNANCFLLTGVAFRAVIEAICLDKNVPGKDLAKKIDNLVRQKLITEKEAQRLHSIRFLGNDSVHEMSVPEKGKLLIVLNIIEHLLNNIYLIDYQLEYHLETVIAFYPEFELLLNVSLNNFSTGDELPLAKIFGKSVRRLNGKIQDFENQLLLKIDSGDCTNLLRGKIDVYGNGTNKIQHFVIK
ncbi:MAG: DUF4145 domain-containing protein [Flavobacterium nitrogenifigens]|uniref:DUF4145 domain-containing protein n=1 Tax=Flavobacterium nitrogenifigens TaxID=1617283 RepID=UPI002809587F|nr:DUF4145 domain-containing protein [Flavobacterium nitrogenifigens]MDQ8013538.1 DUF4145 domain-containing protein [Flavobacterium nitrogenifigens]